MDVSGAGGTLGTKRNLPTVGQTALRGVWLGVQSSLMGSMVFLVADTLLVSLTNPWVDAFDIGTVDGALLFWFIVFLLAGFIVAVVPGAIGGGIIGLVLRMLAHRGKVSGRATAATGILVGTCSGGLAIQIARLLEPEMVLQSSIEAFIAAMLSAVVVGLWHSWRFARWLQKAPTRS